MVHVCDGVFDTRGGMERYALPGEGTVEISRMIELLRGVVFQGFLMFEWPKLWVPELAGPDEALPKVASWLRERVDEKQVILTAYKGDKKPSRFEPLEAS
jgi:sugar phosphate isomerase/epimerase